MKSEELWTWLPSLEPWNVTLVVIHQDAVEGGAYLLDHTSKCN